ncbi:thiamine pyrophosphate-binding protein [Amycolatopsis pithecellobii]|uniref:Thiamine pyrophosphate-binding protein n=1 Tax=Amycolatopsis pithecellobii TaxID=664692 RepID=A0A6N7YW63_9PSEU|nr:thiamine pyrophosphate-binding protein [Amycolatopsis pithecellobii]MTD53113.1 thiamine pyrophosphate-binding protein [Amycolatopsis pithecellobii]
MKGHTSLAAALARHGVTTMFGVMGDGNMFFVDSFIRDFGGEYVAAANEAGAALMAAGYATGSGGVGVATVTHGPGLANCVATLVSATRERRAMVLIAGDTAAEDRTNAQKIDQASLVAPTGAGYVTAASARSAPADLERALARAAVEQRPIVFNVPADFMFAEVADLLESRPALPRQAPAPDPAALDAAVGMIATARRPIVLAGTGVLLAEAEAAVRELAEVLGAPVATTLPARGLFGAYEHDLGVFGTLATPRAVEAILASDCVIAVGTSLNPYTGGGDGWPYLEGKRVVHCDLDPKALTAFTADAAIVADAGAFAETVVTWLREAEHTATGFRDSIDAGTEPGTGDGRPGFVDLAAALGELNRRLPGARTLTVDGGRFTDEVIRRFDVSRPRAWTCSFTGFGAIGNGLAVAIGMGCADRGVPAVALVGDGSFMLGGLAEFSTAVRHGVDLIVVVCNDGCYGAEYRKLAGRGFEIEHSLFDWPDFAPVAESLGGLGCTVRSLEDLAQAEKVVGERDRPVLIDLKLDPAAVHWAH